MSALVQTLAAVSETETTFTAPAINYYAITPILIIFGAAVVSVLSAWFSWSGDLALGVLGAQVYALVQFQ